ncbi:MAG: DUF2157 domain-containing protein [Verrucomicrobia bacterium]|nr:DUF2157 domain-containing protein [Verrucomicrobiota bacterium]
MKTFEERLVVASDEWVGAGLITGGQREGILARHPVPAGAGPNRFLGILAGVGGALFVVGVSLVIKSNWDQIGDWVKIAGVVALLLGSHALGWRLKVSPGLYPKLGDGCFMIGAVMFLLGIALVSQVFHLDSRPANGVLLWWAGIAALPWLVRAKGAQFVSVAAGLTWLGMELAARDSWLRLAVDSGRWYNDSFYLFAAMGFLVGTALLFFGTGLRTGRHADFAGLHEKLGLGLMCWALYALGFTWSVDHWSRHAVEAGRWQPVLLMGVIAAGAVMWARRRNRESVLPLLWLVLPGLVPVLARLEGLDLGDSGWWWGGLACVALFLLNFGMIRVGLTEGREGWINLGIAGIALNIVTRYFLLFGSMLDGGVFFIVTGLLVLGLGYVLERKRRSLVSAVRKEAVS